jgi:hypothetical protein
LRSTTKAWSLASRPFQATCICMRSSTATAVWRISALWGCCDSVGNDINERVTWPDRLPVSTVAHPEIMHSVQRRRDARSRHAGWQRQCRVCSQ